MKNKIISTNYGNFSIYDTEIDKQAVIFISGLSSFAYDFYFTLQDLRKEFRAIAFDRLGLGESDNFSSIRDAENIAAEINALTDELKIDNIIVAAHDSGAIYARKFAEIYPNKCKSLLLLDPITENDDKFDELIVPNWHDMASMSARISAMEQYKDIDRELHKKMLKAMAEIMYEKFPEDIQEKVIEYNSDKKSMNTIIREFRDRNLAFEQINSAELTIPVWVVMRDPRVMITISEQYNVSQWEAKVVEELWLKNIYDMMNISKRSRLIESKGTDHNLPLNSPILIADYVREINKLK